MKFLLIEDESGLRDSIQSYLTDPGDRCEAVADYLSALEKINLYRYDCIILDIGLPYGNGLNIISQLKRDDKSDGILIISAKNSLEDRLKGLEMGADDYLVKPFHLAELKARILAIVRRKSFNGSQQVVFNEISIDLAGKTVLIADKFLKLTKLEYALLIYFIANKGKVISKNALAEHIWGDSADLADNFDFIYSHIKNLRKKLTVAGCKDYIKSAYGLGYKLSNG